MDDLRAIMLKAGYSELAIEYFKLKKNYGLINNPSIQGSFKGECGDTIDLYINIESGIIKDAKFQSIGCAGANTAGSAVTELIKGITIEEAKKIKEKDIITHLGDVPPSKSECISLACKTLEHTLNKIK